MTPDELAALETELADNNEQRAALKERARDIVAKIDQARAADEAAAHIDGLSDTDKAALAQVLNAEGIPSSAVVGDN